MYKYIHASNDCETERMRLIKWFDIVVLNPFPHISLLFSKLPGFGLCRLPFILISPNKAVTLAAWLSVSMNHRLPRVRPLPSLPSLSSLPSLPHWSLRRNPTSLEQNLLTSILTDRVHRIFTFCPFTDHDIKLLVSIDDRFRASFGHRG